MDFDRLQGFPTLSNEISCDVEIKVDAAAEACRLRCVDRTRATS